MWAELDYHTGQPKHPGVESPQEKAARLAEMEPMRLARRAKAREGLAQCRLAEDRLAEVEENLAAIDQRKESAAWEHQQRVAPWQAELAKVEGEQLQRVRDQRDPDPQLDAKRRELLDQIRAATAELEQAIEAEDRLSGQIFQERHELRMKATLRIEYEGELRLTARHDLKLALDVASHQADRAARYADACRNKLSEERSEFWAACLEIAEKELTEKRAASTAALQAILDE